MVEAISIKKYYNTGSSDKVLIRNPIVKDEKPLLSNNFLPKYRFYKYIQKNLFLRNFYLQTKLKLYNTRICEA